MRVAIVEDDEIYRGLIVEQLKEAFPDAECIEIASKTMFDEMLDSEAMDIVILDYSLGWSDGLALLKQIRQRSAHLPVIMLTGLGNEEVAVAGMKAGLNDYVVKGHRHRFIVAINEGLKTAQLSREREKLLEELQRSEAELTRYRSDLEVLVREQTSELLESNRKDTLRRKEAEEMKARLMERVIFAQDLERRRIARELHDEAGQSITSLLIGLRNIEDAITLREAKSLAARLRATTAKTVEDLGRLARGLHPSVLDDLGLTVALQHLASDWEQSHGLVVHFEAKGGGGNVVLPLALQTTIYRIAQEGLTNVIKHAEANVVRMVLTYQPDAVSLVLEDDGKGFELKSVRGAAGDVNRLGLFGMQERATLLGGSLTIQTKPGIGTTIYVQLPLQAFQSGISLT